MIVGQRAIFDLAGASVLLGIDVGTTGVKALLIDPSTKTHHLAQCNFDLIFQEPGHVEQDPLQIWTATKSAIRDVVSFAGRQVRVSSLSISSQGGTLIPVGSDGDPLGRAIVWMDHRAKGQTKGLREKFGDNFFFTKTGWCPTGCLPLLQICWMREENPDLLQKVERFAFVRDYIAYKLSGEWATDPSSAGITMLYNLEKGVWDGELLELAGITESQLPTITDSGKYVGDVIPSLGRELGFRNVVSVSNGGHDQYCASLGAGAMREGDLLLSGGTAWVLLLTSDRPIFDSKSCLAPGRHIIPGRWGLLSSIPAGGAGVNWLRNNLGHFAEGDERGFYEVIEKRCGDIPPGCEGLLFLPHFVGASAPARTTPSKAAILGLGLNHKAPNVFKALLEGVGFEVMWNARTFEGLGLDVNSLSMIGGATNSRIWPQIISDMLGLPLRIPKIQEAACMGAVILAGVGAGIFHGCEEGVECLVGEYSHIRPDEEKSNRYEDLFESYRRASKNLREIQRTGA